MALLPGSPAIDAGDQHAGRRSPDGNPLPGDQRGPGFLRIVNGTVDIGAFESRGFAIALVRGNNQIATVGQSFAVRLTVKVTSTTS